MARASSFEGPAVPVVPTSASQIRRTDTCFLEIPDFQISWYSQGRLPPLDLVLALLAILILSLSFHEAAHAWSADRLGDPTARSLGRLTLNPLAHIDWIGSVLFPLISMTTALPLIGWAKPVPVNLRNLRSPRRDFAIVAFAGPVSNLILATGLIVIFFLMLSGRHRRRMKSAGRQDILIPRHRHQRDAGRVQHDPDSAARRREHRDRPAAAAVGRAG